MGSDSQNIPSNYNINPDSDGIKIQDNDFNKHAIDPLAFSAYTNSGFVESDNE